MSICVSCWHQARAERIEASNDLLFRDVALAGARYAANISEHVSQAANCRLDHPNKERPYAARARKEYDEFDNWVWRDSEGN